MWHQLNVVLIPVDLPSAVRLAAAGFELCIPKRCRAVNYERKHFLFMQVAPRAVGGANLNYHRKQRSPQPTGVTARRSGRQQPLNPPASGRCQGYRLYSTIGSSRQQQPAAAASHGGGSWVATAFSVTAASYGSSWWQQHCVAPHWPLAAAASDGHSHWGLVWKQWAHVGTAQVLAVHVCLLCCGRRPNNSCPSSPGTPRVAASWPALP